MSKRWRRPTQRDANEPEIIDALERAGYSVRQLNGTGVLDLLVSRKWSFDDRWTGLIEVKGEEGPNGGTSGRELTNEQVKFIELWQGDWTLARTPEAALSWCDERSMRIT